MYYYGTDLSQAGHFFWELRDDHFVGRYGADRLSHKSFPFDPEELLQPENGYYLANGTCRFHKIEGYSICAIEGSCCDDRPRSCSIFWIKEDVSNEELIERIKALPIAMKIINQMPFAVKW